MNRQFFNLFYWVSVLILFASVAMGMRSCSVRDSWEASYVHLRGNRGVGSTLVFAGQSNSGELEIYLDITDVISSTIALPPEWQFNHSSSETHFAARNLYFHAALESRLPLVTVAVVHRWFGGYVDLPYWFLLIPGSVAIAWRQFAKPRSRYPTGHCTQCGYDMRMTPARSPSAGTFLESGTGESHR